MMKFYSGYVVKVEAKGLEAGKRKDMALVTVVADYNNEAATLSIGTQHLVRENNLEPLVAELFPIGKEVESVYGGFKGVVVAHELATNRAVCVSNRSDRSRTRYSYPVDELRSDASDEYFSFEIGAKYIVNDDYKDVLTAFEHPYDDSKVLLYNSDAHLVTVAPKHSLRRALVDYSINTIQNL